jgi:prolyl oligopeptidase
MNIGLLASRTPEFVKTSFEMGIAQLLTHPRRNGAILRMQGWVDAPAIVEVDTRGNLHDTKLQPPARADFSQMDEVRLYASAEDGTKIPVTLMYRKTTQLNGDNPTLLVGYGSYGISMRPTFDPARLAWLERGGIYAVAHIRGGGEYGERWHEAGRKATKITTITDFIAVADFLVKYGFTKPQKLAVQGGSAGGIPAGGALVRRPDLFAAVVARVPVMDMLRVEFAPNGPANIPEFGSIATREGFEALLVMSAYHQVMDGSPIRGAPHHRLQRSARRAVAAGQDGGAPAAGDDERQARAAARGFRRGPRRSALARAARRGARRHLLVRALAVRGSCFQPLPPPRRQAIPATPRAGS